MTPHNKAEKEDIAKIVIMPGDPNRAKFIAETYLTDYKLVNDVRGALCYTGYYKDKKVSVMSSGMGMPSMAIYAYELYKFYDVEAIIRVGSCQSRQKDIDISDIIIATSAYTDSNFSKSYDGVLLDTSYPSEELISKLEDTSKRINTKINKGLVWSSDLFYREKEPTNEKIEKAIELEMETFGLFYLANKIGKKSAAVLTVSDSLYNSKQLTPEEREKSFKNAIILVLESII